MRGRLRLEFDGEVHLLDPGSTAHFDANRPHRLGAEGGPARCWSSPPTPPTTFATTRCSATRSPPLTTDTRRDTRMTMLPPSSKVPARSTPLDCLDGYAGRAPARRCTSSPTRSRPAWPRKRPRPWPATPSRGWACAGAGTTSSCASGPNTTKDFMERSEPGVVLGENDIFFVDIGPIYGDTEGDAGDTFVFGDDPDHLRAKREVRRSGTRCATSGSPRDRRQGALRLRHRDARRLRLEAEHGPLRPPPVGLPALGPLRRAAGRGRLPAQPQPVGARDRHRPPRAALRRLLRGPPARRPVIPRLPAGIIPWPSPSRRTPRRMPSRVDAPHSTPRQSSFRTEGHPDREQ